MADVSRRSFLKGAALGIAGFLGPFSVVGCENQGTTVANNPTIQSFSLKEVGSPEVLNQLGQMDIVKFVTDLSNNKLESMLLDEADVVEDYTTPEGQVIPAVYLRLRNRINRLGFGLGSAVQTGKEWDLFMHTFTEEEAEQMMEMPLLGWFTVQDYSIVSNRKTEECETILDGFADKALIWRIRRSGMPHYSLACLIPGFWENYQLWLMAQGEEEKAYEFATDLGSVWAMDQDGFNTYRTCTVTSPVSRDVVKGDMLPYTDWEEVLQQHEHFSVMPCQCRQKRAILGTTPEDCDHPMMTCTSYGELAEFYVEIGIAEELTRDEAIAQIKSNVDLGLAVEGPRNMAGGTYCGCTKCCCAIIGVIRANGEPPTGMPFISDYVLEYDKDKCIGCGICVDRCPMGSRSIATGDDGPIITDDFCFRCGQCAYVCPQNALSLVPVEEKNRFSIPQDSSINAIELGKVRMAQGHIRDFTGDVDAVKVP